MTKETVRFLLDLVNSINIHRGQSNYLEIRATIDKAGSELEEEINRS